MVTLPWSDEEVTVGTFACMSMLEHIDTFLFAICNIFLKFFGLLYWQILPFDSLKGAWSEIFGKLIFFKLADMAHFSNQYYHPR